MYNWNKFKDEETAQVKKVGRLISIFWCVFLILTGISFSCLIPGHAIALTLGIAGFLIATYGWRKEFVYYRSRERFRNHDVMVTDCVEGFLKEKKLLKEYNEYTGKEGNDPKFDWNKYADEIRKRRNRDVGLMFGLWIVYTLLTGFALVVVESVTAPGVALLLLGFAGYVMSTTAYKKMGDFYLAKEYFYFQDRLHRECATEFLEGKGLLAEFNEYSGEELLPEKK
jgi:Flp pilus assembly protein TadB